MKSLVNFALFKEQLKRFWAIAALASLWYILFVVSPLYSSVSNNDSTMYAAENLIRILTMRNFAVTAASVAVPFAAVITIFSYLFQAKSTTAMLSYPLNKKQLFCTNTAAGIVLIAIPLLLLCVCLLNPVVWQLPEMRIDPSSGAAVYSGYLPNLSVELFPNGLADGAVINTLPVVACFFCRALLTSMFYFAVFSLAVTVAGNAVVSFLICGVLPFIPCAFVLLGYLTGSFFLFGFEASWVDDALTKVLTFTNPAMLGKLFTFYYPEHLGSMPPAANMQPHYVIYILIAGGLFAVSYWCFRIRKQERAGDSVVFVPFRNALIFLLSTAGMVFLGAFFLSVFKNVMLMYTGFALGFVITYFIAQMIAEKTFSVLYKAKDIVKYGSIMAALIITVVIAARLDLLGYKTYSPQAGEVYGVYLYQPYSMNRYMGGETSDEYKRNFFVTDEKIIADTLSAHSQIIDDRHSLRSVFLRSLEGNYYENGINEQCFTFLLKNGKYVSRRYALPDEFFQSAGLNGILMEEDIILSQYYSFKTPEKLSRVTLQYNNYPEDAGYDKETERTAYVEPVYIEELDDIISVLEEVKKDIVITERMRLGAGKAASEWRYGMSGYTEIDMMNGSMSVDHFNLYSLENVDRWLESRGLKQENAQYSKTPYKQ